MAEALLRCGGPDEVEVALPILLEAWDRDGDARGWVARVLTPLGPAAAPAADRLRAELAWPRRRGRGTAIVSDDLALTRACADTLAAIESSPPAG